MKPTKLIALTTTLAALALPALACDDPTCPAKLHKAADGTVKAAHAQGHGNHGAHGKPAAANLKGNPAVAEYEAANAKMHTDMAIEFTGDADYDFVAGMIPHHQGAVDMAQVVLRYGQDPQVRRLAREIIRSQNLEIKWMQSYLKQLEARGLKPVAPGTAPKAGFTETGWLGETQLYQ